MLGDSYADVIVTFEVIRTDGDYTSEDRPTGYIWITFIIFVYEATSINVMCTFLLNQILRFTGTTHKTSVFGRKRADHNAT